VGQQGLFLQHPGLEEPQSRRRGGASSGVGKRPGALEGNRPRTRLEGEEGSSGRGLLGGMLGELDEAN
jgi:hypothetical protein